MSRLSFPRKTIIKFLLLCVGILFVIWAYRHYTIVINISSSLPQRIFWVNKGQLPSLGQHVLFKNPIKYSEHNTMIKIVGGMIGDIVEIHGEQISVRGKLIGIIKKRSLKGELLNPGPQGQIKAKQLFVYGLHPDSLDSRYQRIGWIKYEDIVGTAYPIW